MTSNLDRGMQEHGQSPGSFGQYLRRRLRDRSPRATALRALFSVWFAVGMELCVIAIAQDANWPDSAFYTVSALALAVLLVFALPFIEPPRAPKAYEVEGIYVSPVRAGEPETRTRPSAQARYGKDASAGTYRCTNCGLELEIGSLEPGGELRFLPRCPRCGNSEYVNLRGAKLPPGAELPGVQLDEPDELY